MLKEKFSEFKQLGRGMSAVDIKKVFYIKWFLWSSDGCRPRPRFVPFGRPSGVTVFKVSIGAAIRLATSGVWEIEKAEKLADLRDVERI